MRHIKTQNSFFDEVIIPLFTFIGACTCMWIIASAFICLIDLIKLVWL